MDLGFVKNDRIKLLKNIAGIHGMVAVLTKQPIVMLSEIEAKNLTDALADVADYHEINLTGDGGPYGLYLTLIATVYMTYMPRVAQIAMAKRGITVKPMAPATPEEAKVADVVAGVYDFSGDVAN